MLGLLNATISLVGWLFFSAGFCTGDADHRFPGLFQTGWTEVETTQSITIKPP